MQRSVRVVTVDDDPTIGFLLQELLTHEGFDIVAHADSAEEGLELVGRLHPDVVVMDVVMPDMEGVEATRLMRQRHPDVPVVGFTTVPDPTSMLEAGADDCVYKDAHEELLAALKKAVEDKPIKPSS
jgi:CheY-like chemotaxis protein